MARCTPRCPRRRFPRCSSAVPPPVGLRGQSSVSSRRSSGFRDTPVHGCEGRWNTRIIFPDCWNRRSPEETMVSSNTGSVCPWSHPYRIPKISYLIQHKNVDGVVPYHLLVSAGEDTWASWEFMHGDYFTVNQLDFNVEFSTIASGTSLIATRGPPSADEDKAVAGKDKGLGSRRLYGPAGQPFRVPDGFLDSSWPLRVCTGAISGDLSFTAQSCSPQGARLCSERRSFCLLLESSGRLQRW